MLYTFYQHIIRSWWVIAFMLGCLILFEQGLKKRDQHFQQLKDQLVSLQTEKAAALRRQKNLERQVNSQSDLAWIEMTLMKGLGLCPEGQKKVFFQEEK